MLLDRVKFKKKKENSFRSSVFPSSWGPVIYTALHVLASPRRQEQTSLDSVGLLASLTFVVFSVVFSVVFFVVSFAVIYTAPHVLASPHGQERTSSDSIGLLASLCKSDFFCSLFCSLFVVSFCSGFL